MRGAPFDWNVVIVGAWNRAILTPRGVTTRLLQLEAGTPVEVLVALDGMEPMRVKHGNVVVIPSSSQLVVAPVMMTDDGLKRSAKIAARALDALPETPVSAVGVNIRYKFETSPDSVIDMLSSPLDEALADDDQRIVARTLKRSLEWKAGIINLELQCSADATLSVRCNFERRSQEASALAAWIAEAEEMLSAARNLLENVMTLSLEEVIDE